MHLSPPSPLYVFLFINCQTPTLFSPPLLLRAFLHSSSSSSYSTTTNTLWLNRLLGFFFEVRNQSRLTTVVAWIPTSLTFLKLVFSAANPLAVTPTSSCTEGTHHFVARSAGKNK